MNPLIHPLNQSSKEVYEHHFDDDSLFYFSPLATCRFVPLPGASFAYFSRGNVRWQVQFPLTFFMRIRLPQPFVLVVTIVIPIIDPPKSFSHIVPFPEASAWRQRKVSLVMTFNNHQWQNLGSVGILFSKGFRDDIRAAFHYEEGIGAFQGHNFAAFNEAFGTKADNPRLGVGGRQPRDRNSGLSKAGQGRPKAKDGRHCVLCVIRNNELKSEFRSDCFIFCDGLFMNDKTHQSRIISCAQKIFNLELSNYTYVRESGVVSVLNKTYFTSESFFSQRHGIVQSHSEVTFSRTENFYNND